MKLREVFKIPGFFGRGDTPRQPTDDTDGMEEVPVTEEFERCIICGELTDIPVSMPIDARENYEIGLGQVCAFCKSKLRKETGKENTLSNTQIMLVVESDENKHRNW